VSFWVNLANITSGNYALVSNYANDGVNRGWLVGSLTSGKLYFGIYAPTAQETATSATIAINTWYHVTCVYTPNQPTKTYINGTLDSTSSTSANPSYITTHYPGIGASKYNSSDVQQYVSNGTKIDAVNVWNKALTADEVSVLYNSGNGQQYPFSSVTLSNRILDSVNAQNGTLQGGLTLTTGKVGNAFTFNGTSAAVRLPDNSLNSLTGDFSISSWVYLPATYLGTGGATVYILWNVTAPTWANNLKGITLRITSNTIVGFTIYDGVTSASVSFNDSASTYLKNSGWVHITATRKASTGSKLYLNGNLVASNTSAINPVYSSTFQTPNIGNLRTTNSSGTVLINNDFAFNGTKIDGLTIWDKTLTADEVTNLYNTGNGAEYPFSGQTLPSSNDAVGTNHGTLMNGCTFTTGKINKAFTFDGVNDYVALPDNAFNSLNDSFSVSAWFKTASSISNVENYILNNISANTWFNNGNGFVVVQYGNVLNFTIYNNTNTNTELGANYTFSTNTWYHITATKLVNGNMNLYLNGSLVGTKVTTVNPTYLATVSKPCIGALNIPARGSIGYFAQSGFAVDTLSTWNRELTSTEVTELYNSGNGKQYPN
jgi:hypothetical protein